MRVHTNGSTILWNGGEKRQNCFFNLHYCRKNFPSFHAEENYFSLVVCAYVYIFEINLWYKCIYNIMSLMRLKLVEWEDIEDIWRRETLPSLISLIQTWTSFVCQTALTLFIIMLCCTFFRKFSLYFNFTKMCVVSHNQNYPYILYGNKPWKFYTLTKWAKEWKFYEQTSSESAKWEREKKYY